MSEFVPLIPGCSNASEISTSDSQEWRYIPGLGPYFRGLLFCGHGFNETGKPVGMDPFEAQLFIQGLPDNEIEAIKRHPSPDYPW